MCGYDLQVCERVINKNNGMAFEHLKEDIKYHAVFIYLMQKTVSQSRLIIFFSRIPFCCDT